MSAWTTVGRAADVPLFEGRRATIDGHRIAVFHLADGWSAVDAECPHRGGPLQDGLVAEACVTCPLHNWRFDLRTGVATNGDGAVAVHDVRELDGKLQVRLVASVLPAAA